MSWVQGIVHNDTDDSSDSFVSEEFEEEDHVAFALTIHFWRLLKLGVDGLLFQPETGQCDILQDVFEFQVIETFYDSLFADG